MSSRGNAAAVALGPGMLLVSVLGSTEPTDLSTAWVSAWKPVGYTDSGSTQSYTASYDPVEVAEELGPIDSVPTGRNIQVSFSAAELTSKNFQRALNGGTITILGAAPNQFTKFEPPALGAETFCMIGWEAEDHLERWVWRLCKQTGGVETGRAKGASKGLLPMQFTAFEIGGITPFVRLNARGEVFA